MQRVANRIAIVTLAGALAFAAACGGGKTSGGGSDVAATVNGKEITLAEVDRFISRQTGGQQAKMSTLQLGAARLQVLDSLIQRQVLVQRAEKEKTVPTDEEITNTINTQKQRGTVEEWEKFLKENNLTEEQLREEARKDLAIRKLQEKHYGKITVRDQEIVDFYNTNREQFINPRGVFLSDIVADPSDSRGAYPDDAKSDAEAKAKIDRIYAQLKTGGADFATVASASSEDQSRIQGGEIGFAREDDLRQTGFPPELIARLFGPMKPGDITEPIRFPDGRWVIFKLTNRQLENKPLALEDPGVRDQIKQALINQRQTILNEALIRNAMSDATVVNKLAESMLNDPNMLGGLQQAAPGGATPAASPAASPAATAIPAATATPAATPAATATPAGSTAAPKSGAPKASPAR